MLNRWFGKKEKLDFDDEQCSCGLEKTLIFRKDNIFIVPDRDGYDGGVWKKFNGSGIRIGRVEAYDKDGNKVSEWVIDKNG